MAEAVALEVLVGGLDDELGAHGLKGEVLGRVPAAPGARGPGAAGGSGYRGPGRPRVRVVVAPGAPVRGEMAHQLPALVGGKSPYHPDVTEPARGVVEAEDQRTDFLPGGGAGTKVTEALFPTGRCWKWIVATPALQPDSTR